METQKNFFFEINKSYRPDLQLLRGLSVILVVFYHLNIAGFDNGYLGVDIFFVLSGFFMATIADKVGPVEFYKRRLKRLMPAYLVTVFITSLVVVLFTYPVDANQRIDRIFFDLSGLSNFAFWSQERYFNYTAFKPLLNIWSLAIELQFYLIAPFLLPFLRRHKIALIALILGSFLASLFFLTISPKTSFFLLPTRLWEFLFGAYAAWMITSPSDSNPQKLLRFFLIMSLFFIIAFYPISNTSFNILNGHPGIPVLLVVLCTSALLVLRIDKIININNSISKLFIKVGDYSYSIYLTHFPIIVLINYIPFGGTKLGFDTLWDLAVILILTAISSYLLFNYVENLRHKKNTIPPILGLFLICSLLGLFGSNINSSKYSEKELAIFNAFDDRQVYRCTRLFKLLNLASNSCQIGNVISENRVLLLGSSHANSIKNSFTNSMDKEGLSTYFYVYNDPLMNEKHNEKIVLDEIIKNKINSVVIHFHAEFFDNPKYSSRLSAFLKLLENLDVPVFFIGTVPTYNVNVPKAMLAALRDPSFIFPHTTLSKYYSASSNFFKFVKDNKIDSNFIEYPHLLMCTPDKCIYKKNGIPYYYDDNHLTLTGAKDLSPLFDKLAFSLSNLER
jgi:peptidoglycan/LPS O-acetylase OafA/YrhL